jgi:hypothetical protein
MRRSEQTKADVVEDQRKRVVPRVVPRPRLTVDDPSDFKGAPKGKRDRAAQVAQTTYGKHTT